MKTHAYKRIIFTLIIQDHFSVRGCHPYNTILQCGRSLFWGIGKERTRRYITLFSWLWLQVRTFYLCIWTWSRKQTRKQAITGCFPGDEFFVMQSFNIYMITCFKIIDMFTKCNFYGRMAKETKYVNKTLGGQACGSAQQNTNQR